MVDKAGLEEIRRLLIEEGQGPDLTAAVRNVERLIDETDDDHEVSPANPA